jgi:HEAT repeat protein
MNPYKMTETELYKSLGALTKDKEVWEENIPYVESLLTSESAKIKSKALWMLGEMGLAFPSSIKSRVATIASFRNSTEPILRERAINALGRIGRGCFNSVEPYWDDLFRFAHDEDASVRLAFIWASENIATNTPDPYKDHMPLFAELLHDSDDRVRMEAPEIFRVLGKRRPDFVKPYIDRLQSIAETDSNRVVKIHCQGAIRAAK